MREGTIEVVRHEGELLFQCGDVFLDVLESYDFYYAEIIILRGGVVFDKGDVHEIGTHAPVPVFGGLGKTRENLPRQTRQMYCFKLFPNYFKEGDCLRFELPRGSDRDVDFKNDYAKKELLSRYRPEMDRIRDIEDNDEFLKASRLFRERFEQELASFVFPPVIIFRRKNSGPTGIPAGEASN